LQQENFFLGNNKFKMLCVCVCLLNWGCIRGKAALTLREFGLARDESIVVFEDETIYVKAVPVFDINNDNNDAPSNHCCEHTLPVLPIPFQTLQQSGCACQSHDYQPTQRVLSTTTTSSSTLATTLVYIVQCRDQPGKFDAKRATALGVNGPSRALLVRGESVTLDDGRVVQPSDCIAPAIPGAILLLVHISSLAQVCCLSLFVCCLFWFCLFIVFWKPF
jgi:hypothetical protein